MLASVGILAILAGFWIGRWSVPMGALEGEGEIGAAPLGENGPVGGTAVAEGDGILKRQSLSETAENDEGRVGGGGGRESRGRRNHNREKRIPLGWAIGSPVAGDVSLFYEGSRRGALILSDQGRMYAPASGKITKLYPMGNRMMLRTDAGVELLLQVGGQVDELCGSCFRPRVVQNEIVNKGKLLLEYDTEGLLREGADVGVSISVETADSLQNITVTGKKRVKAGEELLWIREQKE